jgi:hypothetical protein
MFVSVTVDAEMRTPDAGPDRLKAALRDLKIQLLQLGWTYSDLATRTGIRREEIKALACGEHSSRFGRRKIEALLNVPIWSTPQQHRTNQRLAKALGIDPICSRADAIRSAILKRKLGRFPSRASKTVLLKCLRRSRLSSGNDS